MIRISYAVRSDMGRKNPNNEDNLYCDGHILTAETRDLPFEAHGSLRGPAAFAVFDGLGGYQAGEVASFIGAEMLRDEMPSLLGDDREGRLRRYASRVTREIVNRVKESAAPMGTTLALAGVEDDSVCVCHIGDSRVYALDEAGFRLLTTDHTLAMYKVRIGLLSEAEARQSKDWSRLTACLGFLDAKGDEYPIEVGAPLIRRGTMRLLLCSDGLSDMVDDARIEQILRSAAPREAASQLMNEALNNGGVDNVTVLVVEIKEDFFARLKYRFFQKKGEVDES
ncbi:MAG: protein phosphatase 2C domain-containing protein [Bacillota bacterium]|nr:protein phosphatase 2C domain-containing protein [Bacillota bacterium]